MSGQSNMTITTILSGKTSVASPTSKRDKSYRSKKSLSDDGFVVVFRNVCQELGLQPRDIPGIRTMNSEPISWVISAQPISEEKKVRSANLTSGRISVEKSKSATGTSIATMTQGTKTTSHIYSASTPTDIEKSSKNHILAIFNNMEVPSILSGLIYKHFPMEDNIMAALQISLIQYSTIKILKLEYCNLTCDQIKAVKFLLNKNDGIIDISLDGNPIPKQNFYILLKETKLLHLSLKFCKIDDRGVSKIADYITYPSSKLLVALNLSNNLITDNGCKFLANALRTNRSLTHLCISDNFIDDNGCIYIVEVLQKFALTHEEVVFRRKCNMEYLLRINIAIAQQKLKLRNVISSKTIEIVKSERKFISKSSAKFKKDKTLLSSSSSVKKKKAKSASNDLHSQHQQQQQQQQQIKVEGVVKDPHPYMHECSAEKQKMYCRGNFKLSYLNLAYNNITCKGLTAIKDMLKYQYVIKFVNRVSGISKLIIEGNRLENCEDPLVVTDMLSGRSGISTRGSYVEKSRKLRSQ